jgi:hypothetical protein
MDLPVTKATAGKCHAGYLVRPGDINELSLRIANLLRDQNLQKEMGDRARVSALPFTDKERFINKLLSTWEDAVESFGMSRYKGVTEDANGSKPKNLIKDPLLRGAFRF